MIRAFRTFSGALALGLLAVTPLAAQGRDRGQDSVPAGYRPPPGMCRIWVDGVPPNQQPAPTDCPTAVKNKPDNGRVIFGEPARPGSARNPLLKGFGERERKVEPKKMLPRRP